MSLKITEVANEISETNTNHLLMQFIDSDSKYAVFTDRDTNAEVEITIAGANIKAAVITRLTEPRIMNFQTVPEFLEWYNPIDLELQDVLHNSLKEVYISNVRETLKVSSKVQNLELYNIAMGILVMYPGAKIVCSDNDIYEFEYAPDNVMFLSYNQYDKHMYNFKFIRAAESYNEECFTGIKAYCRSHQHSMDPKLMSINDMALEFVKRIQNITLVSINTQRVVLSNSPLVQLTVFKFVNHWVCEAISMEDKFTIRFTELNKCFNKLAEKGLI